MANRASRHAPTHRKTSGISSLQRSNPLPHEIVEMIVDYLIYDLQTLKACSLTCHSWYIAAAPHIHHTFVLRGVKHLDLKPLSNRHALGLLPFVKELRIPLCSNWFLPDLFRRRGSRHFFAFTNVQNLTAQYMEIGEFIPRLVQYFGHLSPTLRSLTLVAPRCTPLQLSNFISLFPNLDDITIQFFAGLTTQDPDNPLVPFSTPKLQGRLSLTTMFARRPPPCPTFETWKHLAASGGLRFRSLSLSPVSKCAPVLFSACSDTLETLWISPSLGNGARPLAGFTTYWANHRQNIFNPP